MDLRSRVLTTNLRAVCLLLTGLLVATSCNREAVLTTSPGHSMIGPHYIRRANANTVIVFVHGVFGDAQSTWTNPESRAFWPDLLTGDEAFNGADIYVLSFDSPYVRTASTIDELVEQAHQDLVSDEVFSKHGRVIFVCHSMGGLVTRKILTRYQPLARSVPLIYFFATPTEGAEITRLALAFSDNPQVIGMLPAGADNYVTLLQRDWRAAQFHIVSRCAFEQKPTHGVQIVNQMSASQLCDGPVLPIARDHTGIVKPLDRNDRSYVAFRAAYIEAVRSGVTEAAQAPGSSMAAEVTTAALVTHPVEVRCGGTIDQTSTISFSSAQHPRQRMVDAVVSIQQASNLKYQSAEVKDRTSTDVVVHYRLGGLDPDAEGRCTLNGQATLTVAFLLAGPAITEPPDRVGMKMSQITRGDMSPTIAGVGGDVTIIRNAEPAGGGPSSSMILTPSVPGLSPLTLATNPSMHGLLLDQRTRGELSPALAAIAGNVLIQDNIPPGPKRRAK